MNVCRLSRRRSYKDTTVMRQLAPSGVSRASSENTNSVSSRRYRPAHVRDHLKARISFRLGIGDLVGKVSEPAFGFKCPSGTKISVQDRTWNYPPSVACVQPGIRWARCSATGGAGSASVKINTLWRRTSPLVRRWSSDQPTPSM